MTSKTRSALTTEQTTNFADNTTGAITPAILRTTMQDFIDSFATQQDSSAFTGSAYSFTGSIAFSGVLAVGSTSGLFVSSAAGILGGSISTSSLILQSTNFGSTQTGDAIFVQGASITLKANASIATAVNIGAAGSAYGTLAIAGSTSGAVTIAPPGAASGTQTLQATTDTFVYLATTDTLTNKTIGSALGFVGSTSGTMFVKATGAAGSGTLTLPAATDTLMGRATTDIMSNKTLNIGSTSTIIGTITNDSATAGNIGEYIESVIASGSPVTLTSASTKTITSIALTAGDWDVTGSLDFTTSTSTSITQLGGCMALSGNTFDSTNGRGTQIVMAAVVPGASTFAFGVPLQTCRFSFSVSTTVFMSALAVFSAGGLFGWGMLRARRPR